MSKTVKKKKALLWRYTTLPVLIDILLNKQITLLSPEKWQDKNDSYFMEIYKRKRDLKTLLALCLADTSERFHLWRSFSYGSDGVCITFKKDGLIHAIQKSIYKGGIRFQEVKYRSVVGLENSPPKVKELPFIKRLPYRDECEYRIVFESRKESFEFLPIPIELSCIKEVTLGPSINQKLHAGVKKVLKSIPGFTSISIISTTVEENQRWKQAGDAAVD